LDAADIRPTAGALFDLEAVVRPAAFVAVRSPVFGLLFVLAVLVRFVVAMIPW
jgi:hypothetical protein